MKASVCMASFNRDPLLLRRVLGSIFSQDPPFEFEVIVVDDGSAFGAPDVCADFPVKYHRIDRDPVARNASVARNIAYRMVRGDIIIAQSDDVVHQQNDSLEVLCEVLEENPGSFIIANVLGCNTQGEPYRAYTGVWKDQRRHAPLFFLGSVWRKDLYAVGGEDEDFEKSGGHAYEDKWFGTCLMNGLRITPIYTYRVIAHHINHPRRTSNKHIRINERLYDKKREEAESTGVWCSAGGPWSEEN